MRDRSVVRFHPTKELGASYTTGECQFIFFADLFGVPTASRPILDRAFEPIKVDDFAYQWRT